jgi:hypothetical protein
VRVLGPIVHGPLHKDDLAQRLRDRGVADPDAALKPSLDENNCPATQLVDDRLVWLPTVPVRLSERQRATPRSTRATLEE